MKFCPSCGAAVQLRIPDGDHLPRSVCPACGTIHYQNPKLVVGAVAEFEGRIGSLGQQRPERQHGYGFGGASLLLPKNVVSYPPRANASLCSCLKRATPPPPPTCPPAT